MRRSALFYGIAALSSVWWWASLNPGERKMEGRKEEFMYFSQWLEWVDVTTSNSTSAQHIVKLQCSVRKGMSRLYFPSLTKKNRKKSKLRAQFRMINIFYTFHSETLTEKLNVIHMKYSWWLSRPYELELRRWFQYHVTTLMCQFCSSPSLSAVFLFFFATL